MPNAGLSICVGRGDICAAAQRSGASKVQMQYIALQTQVDNFIQLANMSLSQHAMTAACLLLAKAKLIS